MNIYMNKWSFSKKVTSFETTKTRWNVGWVLNGSKQRWLETRTKEREKERQTFFTLKFDTKENLFFRPCLFLVKQHSFQPNILHGQTDFPQFFPLDSQEGTTLNSLNVLAQNKLLQYWVLASRQWKASVCKTDIH